MGTRHADVGPQRGTDGATARRGVGRGGPRAVPRRRRPAAAAFVVRCAHPPAQRVRGGVLGACAPARPAAPQRGRVVVAKTTTRIVLRRENASGKYTVSRPGTRLACYDEAQTLDSIQWQEN